VAFPDRFSRSLTALSHSGANLSGLVLPLILNELWALDQDVVLILDDFDVVTSSDCIESFRHFIDRLLPTVRVVVASRSDPPIGLKRLRRQGRVAELRGADLRFTPEEVVALLNGTFSLGLTRASLARLVQQTEGWAAGLHMAALTMRDHPNRHGFVAAFTDQSRQFLDYLGADVLVRLPPEDRAFLAQTAILEQLSIPLCDTVRGSADAGERLRRLAKQNLFVVPLDEEGEWYRHHHLFRELLLVELEHRSPDCIPQLHQRAAAWYHTAG
jgi:LuxR family maltose regulon positive regulatory protein